MKNLHTSYMTTQAKEASKKNRYQMISKVLFYWNFKSTLISSKLYRKCKPSKWPTS